MLRSAEFPGATGGFGQAALLAKGGTSDVFKGTLPDGSLIAIKRLIGQETDFQTELGVLGRWRHPNIALVLGWGRHQSEQYLISEYLSGGDVHQRLWKDNTWKWAERLQMLIDVASGLNHMHTSTPKVLHRDIKPANILLDQHGTAKLADCGLSLICELGQNSARAPNMDQTPGYTSPTFAACKVYSRGSDVYSLMIVALEVLTKLPPCIVDAAGRFTFPLHSKLSCRAALPVDLDAKWPRDASSDLAKLAVGAVCEMDDLLRPSVCQIGKALRDIQAKHHPGPPTTIFVKPTEVTVVRPSQAPLLRALEADMKEKCAEYELIIKILTEKMNSIEAPEIVTCVEDAVETRELELLGLYCNAALQALDV